MYNNQKIKTRRRLLRKNQTDAETKLWYFLRRKKILGFRFFRQYSIGTFILDFYCPKARLGIELDGGQHNQEIQKARDNERTLFLSSQHITVLRFWNNEILANTDGVLEVITKALGSNPS